MKTMTDFFRTMLTLPKPWVAWIALLLLVNLVLPLVHYRTLEGKVVLAAFAFGTAVQMVIFSARGFVRLLGVGHVLWGPMAYWLSTRLAAAPQGSLFRYWLLATIVLVSVSLVIDAVDVIRYVRGERKPQLSTPV